MNEMQISGVEDVVRRLRQLPVKLQKKQLRRAVRKGANVFRDAARVRARAIDDPTTPTSIPKEIVAQESAKQGRRVGGVYFKVGVRGGARQRKGIRTPFYWRFLEFGTEKMAARPFMRPAMTENLENATNAVVGDLVTGIDEALKEIG